MRTGQRYNFSPNRHADGLRIKAGDSNYAWVTRHTWQSWRERYKKNASRLDARISAIVEQKRPAQGEKGQYGYVRQPEEKPKRTRKKRKADQVDESYMHALEGLVGLPGIPPMPPNSQMPPHMGMHPGVPVHNGFPVMEPPPGIAGPGPSQQGPPIPGPYPPMIPMPSPSQPPHPPPMQDIAGTTERRKNPTREEDEEPEWAVKIGNAPPPQWAHPIPDGDSPNKRPRFRFVFTTNPEIDSRSLALYYQRTFRNRGRSSTRPS